MTLPDTIDFDETEYPELVAIFRDIDAGIAAILAEELAARTQPVMRRRTGRATPVKPRRTQPRKKAAA